MIKMPVPFVARAENASLRPSNSVKPVLWVRIDARSLKHRTGRCNVPAFRHGGDCRLVPLGLSKGGAGGQDLANSVALPLVCAELGTHSFRSMLRANMRFLYIGCGRLSGAAYRFPCA